MKRIQGYKVITEYKTAGESFSGRFVTYSGRLVSKKVSGRKNKVYCC